VFIPEATIDFAAFDTRDSKELAAYRELLNDPLVTILSDDATTLENTDFEDGKPTGKETYIQRSVKWRRESL
jgi:hypothetical protein